MIGKKCEETEPELINKALEKALILACGGLSRFGLSYHMQTLEKRLEDLEKKVAQLAAQKEVHGANSKDWLRTFGLSRDDQGYEEMIRLGREYRHNRKDLDNSAGP